MATAKQLAALKKARAAKKRNAAKKTARKTPRKTTRKTTRKTSASYSIYILSRGKRYYYTGKSFDDEVSKARSYSNAHIADAAIEMAKTFGHTAKKTKK